MRTLGYLAAALVVLFIAAGHGSARHEPLALQCTPLRMSGSSQTGGAGGFMFRSTLQQMTDESDIVVMATVRGFQSCLDDGGRSIVTFVSFTPDRPLKGKAAGPLALTLRGGGLGQYRLAVGATPEFTVGERAVLFLRRTPAGRLVLTQAFQSKLSVAANGAVAAGRVWLLLPELERRITAAAQGALPSADDPLAHGAALVEGAFVTIGGLKFSTSHIPVPLFVNPDSGRPAHLTAQQVRLAAAGAFHAWQQLPDSYIAFGPFGNTTRLSGSDGCPFYDGFNDTTWGIADPDHASNVLAMTSWCFVGDSIVDGDVQIDNDHWASYWAVDGIKGNCDGFPDLWTTLLHEYGHVLGLGHPSNNSGCAPCPVMDASYGAIQRTPCADDAAGAASLYPLGPGSPPLAPSFLAVLPSASIVLNWADVSGELGFEVWRATKDCLAAAIADFALLDTVPANTLSYTDSDYGGGLTPAQAYCYRVRSFNTSGESAFSFPAGAVAVGPLSGTATPTSTPTPIPTPTATPTFTPVPYHPIEVQLDDCLAATDVAWSFDNETKEWSSFDPDLPHALQGLKEFVPARAYFVHARATCEIDYGENILSVYPGWNLFGWR